MKELYLFIQKAILVISFILLQAITAICQSADLQIIASSGGYVETPQLHMSWTVGDIIINTQNNNSYITTQGFQQSFLVNGPLPINLLHFYGEVLPEGNELSWETNLEINNDYFTLLRSIDGFSFIEITTIEGLGSSTTKQNYQYLDHNAPTGRIYYRLDQTDLDGKITSSEIITLERWDSFSNLNFNVQLFPNPVVNELNITFETELPEIMHVQLYDMWGRLLIVHVVSAGQRKLIIDVSEIPTGMYFINLQNESNHLVISSSRIVKASL